MDLELKNPFIAGKVISKNTDPAVYRNNARRGAPDFVMSRSDLMEFAHCPARWVEGYQRKQTEEMDWGTLVENITCNRANFERLFVIAPNEYPSSGKKKDDPPVMKPWNYRSTYCQEWRESAEKLGKQVITTEDYKLALKAREKLFGNELIRDLIESSDYQVMVIAQFNDAATGLEVGVKILIDLLPKLQSHFPKCIADLKTCYSGDPRVWARHVKDCNLHVQAALYLDVYAAATGEDRDTFLHPIQENYAPWHVIPTMLSQDYIELGRRTYVNALHTYCRCLKENSWPSYQADNWIQGWRLTEPEAWMIGN